MTSREARLHMIIWCHEAHLNPAPQTRVSSPSTALCSTIHMKSLTNRVCPIVSLSNQILWSFIIKVHLEHTYCVADEFSISRNIKVQSPLLGPCKLTSAGKLQGSGLRVPVFFFCAALKTHCPHSRRHTSTSTSQSPKAKSLFALWEV